MHVPLDEVRRMFDVNVFGLLQVTRAFCRCSARESCPHAPGRVINISSISGGLVFPFVGVYGATKHAVEALTDGLRRELAISGIQVVAIEPGNIRTPIWEKDDDAGTRFADTAYAPMMAKLPGIVAEMGRKGAPGETVSRRDPSRDRRAAPEDALSADLPVAPLACSRRPCARPPDPLGDGPLSRRQPAGEPMKMEPAFNSRGIAVNGVTLNVIVEGKGRTCCSCTAFLIATTSGATRSRHWSRPATA